MDGYSRLIALLKILLPLMALAILSTLFLLSRNTDPTGAIPFAEADIRDRLEHQQVTGPFFSGTTNSGDLVTLSAESLRSLGATSGAAEAAKVSAQFDLSTGKRIVLIADAGVLNMSSASAELSGNVVFTTSDGMRLVTELINSATDTLDLSAPGRVAGSSPFGTLEAGAMRLQSGEGENSAHLIFSKGVRLVYQPKGVDE